MNEESGFFDDYNFYGSDDAGMTSNNMEIMKYLFGDEPLAPPINIKWTPPPNGERKSKRGSTVSSIQHFNESPKPWTPELTKAALIYAMKDSLKMGVVEFALNYCPTITFSNKGAILFTLETKTILGITDIDWALTLVATGLGIISIDIMYAMGKPLWNKLRGEKLLYLYDNPSEINAKIMARMMTDHQMKFHHFFPSLMADAENNEYSSFYYKTLCETYGTQN